MCLIPFVISYLSFLISQECHLPFIFRNASAYLLPNSRNEGESRGPAGRIAGVRYVLPRHKAATWVGPGRGRKSTRPGANGVVELTPFEFLDRLADLVPPPRKHRHRYHGVFAPNHKLRKAVTALAIGNIGKPREAANGGHGNEGRDTGGCCDAHRKPRSHDTSRIAWAKLMARVGEEFRLACPTCGGDIRLISFITEPGPIRKILTHLGEPLEPPPQPLIAKKKRPRCVSTPAACFSSVPSAHPRPTRRPVAARRAGHHRGRRVEHPCLDRPPDSLHARKGSFHGGWLDFTDVLLDDRLLGLRQN